MSHKRQFKLRTFAAVAAAVMVLAAGCGSSSKTTSSATTTASSPTSGSSSSPSVTSGSGSTAGNTTGVSSSSITIGTVADVSGPIPGLFQGAIYGTEAYADYINSLGGVNGRKIVVKTGDTALSCTVTKNKVQSLSTQVYAFVGSSADFDNCEVPVFQANPNLQTIGYAYSDQLKAIASEWNPQPAPKGQWTGPYLQYKQQNPAVTQKVGGLYQVIPSSEDNYNQTKAMLQSLGYKFIYENGSPYGSTNFTSQVLAMKQAGVQFVYMTNLSVEADASVLNSMQQQGFHPAFIECATCYDGNFFKLLNPGAGNGVSAEQYWLMFLGQDRSSNAEVNLYLTWLNKVKPGFKPDFFSFYSWVSSALFVQALKAEGSSPTRTGLVTALKGITSFNDNGLVATSNPGQGKPNNCWERIEVVNNQWVHVVPTTATYQCNPGGFYYYTK